MPSCPIQTPTRMFYMTPVGAVDIIAVLHRGDRYSRVLTVVGSIVSIPTGDIIRA